MSFTNYISIWNYVVFVYFYNTINFKFISSIFKHHFPKEYELSYFYTFLVFDQQMKGTTLKVGHPINMS